MKRLSVSAVAAAVSLVFAGQVWASPTPVALSESQLDAVVAGGGSDDCGCRGGKGGNSTRNSYNHYDKNSHNTYNKDSYNTTKDSYNKTSYKDSHNKDSYNTTKDSNNTGSYNKTTQIAGNQGQNSSQNGTGNKSTQTSAGNVNVSNNKVVLIGGKGLGLPRLGL